MNIAIYNPSQCWLLLASASFICDRSFTVLATVITIINYDRKTFIAQPLT